MSITVTMWMLFGQTFYGTQSTRLPAPIDQCHLYESLFFPGRNVSAAFSNIHKVFSNLNLTNIFANHSPMPYMDINTSEAATTSIPAEE